MGISTATHDPFAPSGHLPSRGIREEREDVYVAAS